MAETVPLHDLHRIVATCLVYRGRRYLIKKRHPDRQPFPGRWEVPGGGVEAKDYEGLPKGSDGWENVLERVVRREVEEEVNIRVGRPAFIGDSFFVRHDGIPVIVLRFAAPFESGEVALDDEATEYRWVTSAEIGSYEPIGSIVHDIRRLDLVLEARE